jgi:hypothetical protein
MLCDSESAVGVAGDGPGPTVTSTSSQFSARHGGVKKKRPAIREMQPARCKSVLICIMLGFKP